MSENPKEAAHSCAAKRRVVALFLLAFAAATPGAARGQDAIGRGRAYLASRQLPSGWFQGATPTDVVEAIGVTDDADARQRALVALALAIPDNTEAALARLVALAGSPYADPLSSEAHRLALAAGEVGLAPGSVGRDPLVLAWALRLALVDPDFAPLAPYLGLAGFGFESGIAREEFDSGAFELERVYQIGPAVTVFSKTGWAFFIASSIMLGGGALVGSSYTTWTWDVSLAFL